MSELNADLQDALESLEGALSGHADSSTVPWFTVGVQWFHLVSVGAWVEGLAWLLVAIRRGDLGRSPGLARRFSTVAAGGLGVITLTGTLRASSRSGRGRDCCIRVSA